jgi:hypothetical protein
LKVNDENRGFGSISQRHGSPDSDPYLNVTDPQHWMGQKPPTEKLRTESSALSCLDSKAVAQVQLHGEEAQQLSPGEQRGT